MVPLNLEEGRLLARKMLGDFRYAHTLAVSRLAGELALCYGADADAARLAGMVHDITKELPLEGHLEILKKAGLLADSVATGCENQLQTGENSAIMLKNSQSVYPYQLHALTASLYLEQEGVRDPDLLAAVRFHTTCREEMSLLEKVVFAADKYSYDRTYEDAGRLRELAFEDLHAAMLEFFEFDIVQDIKKRRFLALDSVRCYNQLCREGPLYGSGPAGSCRHT